MHPYTKTLTTTFRMPTHVKQKHMNVRTLIHAPGSVFFFFLLNLLELQQGFKTQGVWDNFPSAHTLTYAENQPAPVLSQRLFVYVCLRIIRNITAPRHKGETDTQIRFGSQSPQSAQITSCTYTHTAQKQTPHAQGEKKKKS